MCLGGGSPAMYTSAIGPTAVSGAPMGAMAPGFGGMTGFQKTMLGLGAFQAFSKGMKSFKESSATKDVLLYKANLQRRNAEIEAVRIKDAKRRGTKERQALKRKFKLVRASQRVGYAGKNILLGGGTPLDIMLSTGVLEVADLGTLKQKEEREIFGLEVAKYNATAAAEFLESTGQAISPFTEGLTSMLTSGVESGFSYLAWKHQPVGTGRQSLKRFLA